MLMQNQRLENARDIATMSDETARRGQNITQEGNQMRYNLGLNAQDIERKKMNLDAYFKEIEGNRKQYETWAKTPEGKFSAAYQLCKLNGIDPNSAEGKHYIQIYSSDGKWGKEDSYIETVNLFGSQLTGLKKSLYSGDIDGLKEQIQTLRESLKNPESDFAKKFNAFQTAEVNEFLDLYEKAADGKIGVMDFANMSYALEHPGWKPDPDKDPEWYLNMSPEEKTEFGKLVANGWKKK